MRKIFLLLLLTTIVAIFTSCKEEDSMYHTGVAINLSDTDYYILDPGVTGELTSSLPNLDFEVLLNDEVIKTFSTVDGAATYTFTQADFNYMVTGSDTAVKFLTHIDGGPAAKYAKFSVKNPLTIEGLADFYPATDTTIYIKFKLAANCTAPTSLVVTQQRNSEAPVALSQTFNVYGDAVPIALTNNMIFDTLTYSFTFSNENGVVEGSHVLRVVIRRSWDFEDCESWSADFAPWIFEDLDGSAVVEVDEFDYSGEGDPAAFRIFDFTMFDNPVDGKGWEAKSGNKFAFAMAPAPSSYNDDWMSVDNFDIEVDYGLSLYAKSFSADHPERLVVIIIDNSDNTETVLTGDENVEYSTVPNDWTNYKWDLSDWAGKNIKVKVGCVSRAGFAMFVDDFEIIAADGKSVFKNSFEKPSNKPVVSKKVLK